MENEEIMYRIESNPDYRIESLRKIINALDDSISILKKRMKEEGYWYDGLMFLYDTESIYGLAFIAFQIYINGSIKDFSKNSSKKNKKEEYYKIATTLKDFEKSSVELIIGLANYSKHKDEGKELHDHTRTVLESFNLNTNIELESEIYKSPIFEGLPILSDKRDLFEVLQIVITWREKLWVSEKLQNQ